MIRRPISRRTELILGVCSILFILLAYSVLSVRQHHINPKDTTIPNLAQFVQGWQKLLHADSTGHIWLLEDFRASGTRLFLAVGTGVTIAFILGVSMGVNRYAEAFFKWPLLALGSVPPTAMLALYFVILGTDMNMYVGIIASGIIPYLAISILNSSHTDVSDNSIYKAYTLGASDGEVILEVVVRQILPRIIDSARLCIGPAMVFLIAAEWATADVGFGYRLKMQSRLLSMNIVYTYLILLGLSGFLMDYGLLQLRKKLCPWFEFTKN